MTLAAIGPGFFPLIGRGIGSILLYAVLGVLLMLLGFWAIDITTPSCRAKALSRSRAMGRHTCAPPSSKRAQRHWPSWRSQSPITRSSRRA